MFQGIRMDKKKLLRGTAVRLLGLCCLVAVLLPAAARASGAITRLSLKQAVEQASVVLVVEKARPAREKRTLKIPYRRAGKRRVARIEVRYLRLRYLRDGTRKIPYYPTLAEEIGRADLEKGRRFVLLATFNTAYEALEGVGGLGLLPAASEKQVLGAIDGDRLVPLGPAPAPRSTQNDATESSGSAAP
jgi:hypothetical protein